MTVRKDLTTDIVVFIIALAFTVIIAFKLHLFEPVLKHHYNHRKKENRKKRKTKYGLYNREHQDENNNANK